ncbi:hypothetical protein [Streptomyces silvensis]|uniref:hypothetical protein n=1 Tax=Streptomyces silvensis TaxID=1765722 RepID=UPI0012FEE098|nr:hypothetical protein [Streptomyces silvensis]
MTTMVPVCPYCGRVECICPAVAGIATARSEPRRADTAPATGAYGPVGLVFSNPVFSTPTPIAARRTGSLMTAAR